MPDLPTITVTQQQADRLMEIFTTPAEYRSWLRKALRDEAKRRYAKSLQDQLYASLNQSIHNLEIELPPEE